MKNDLILYRNELKNRNLPKYKLMGICSDLILSKDIFKNNKDLKPFIIEVFNIEFREYVFLSRSTLSARVSRVIYDSEEKIYVIYRKKLYKYVESNIYLKENEKNIFNGWLN
ncbi:hypothetical protein [Enterococcus durans]|uniref:hypothetical protein n=1 Tax=Enterococcus durans TaxID=53345 RepID=UPI00356453BB